MRDDSLSDPNAFAETSPWGTHLPRGRGSFWLAVARALPGGWPWRRLALLVRRAARRHLTGPVDTEVWGQRLRLFQDRSVSEARILFLPRAWDRAERRMLAKWRTPGFTFVDVGANVGGYSFWVLSLMGASGLVVAVEPHPDLARQLRFNVRTNRAEDRMRVVEAAVGAERGGGTLLVGARNSGESRLVREDATAGVQGESLPVREDATTGAPRASRLGEADTSVRVTGRYAPGATIPVAVLTLADVVREAGLYRIDCLKVDVEGHEAEVILPFLQSSPRALWPRHLIVELKQARRTGQGSPGLEEWLVARGYRPVLRTRLNGLFTLASGHDNVLL